MCDINSHCYYRCTITCSTTITGTGRHDHVADHKADTAQARHGASGGEWQWRSGTGPPQHCPATGWDRRIGVVFLTLARDAKTCYFLRQKMEVYTGANSCKQGA